MSERDDYMSYVGDIAGQAEENLLNSMLDSIAQTLKELKELIDEDSFFIVKEKFKIDFPIIFKEEEINEKWMD